MAAYDSKDLFDDSKALKTAIKLIRESINNSGYNAVLYAEELVHHEQLNNDLERSDWMGLRLKAQKLCQNG